MKIIVKSDKQKQYAHELVDKCDYENWTEITFKKYKPDRSLSQNNLLHMWLAYISKKYAEATGDFYDVDEWKTEFKKRFLGYESKRTPSGIVKELKHTSQLKLKDMAEFLETIDHYCGSVLMITDLPRPDDYHWIMHGKN